MDKAVEMRTTVGQYARQLRDRAGISEFRGLLRPPSELKPEYVIVLAILSLYLIVLLRTAWISDDAYITFRTISNFAAGKGLVWNVSERVQTYTHPLWMFFVMAGVYFTHEFFYTSLALSVLVSVTSALIFARWIARTPMMAVFGTFTMIISRAFVDYSTSGLENALSHLILVMYLAVYFTLESSNRKLFLLSLLTALAGLNRLDLLLIYLPSLGYEIWKCRKDRPILVMLAGFVPLMVWEAFSIIYYGFPFPNTAYAKLNTGVPPGDLIEQGFFYLMDSMIFDPITLLIIAAGVAVAIYMRRGPSIAVAVGIVLYLIYIVRIGGDFMSGRFLTVPLLASLCIIARIKLPDRWVLAASGAVLAAGFASGFPTLVSDRSFGEDNGPASPWRISDERAFYFQETGLIQAKRYLELPNHEWVRDGIAARNQAPSVQVATAAGLFGFYAGREVEIIDVLGITDPLLGRLPPAIDPNWRIAHMERRIPGGYVESRELGSNEIVNPHLAEYYDKLGIVIKGPILSAERLSEIWRLNTGAYDHLVQSYLRSLPRIVSIGDITRTASDGVGSSLVFGPDGLRIDLGDVVHVRKVRIWIDRSANYTVIFSNHRNEIARKLLPLEGSGRTDILEYVVGISADEARQGFDEIAIYPPIFADDHELAGVQLID